MKNWRIEVFYILYCGHKKDKCDRVGEIELLLSNWTRETRASIGVNHNSVNNTSIIESN